MFNSSDFTPGEVGSKVRGHYECDGDVVTVQFIYDTEDAGAPFTFTRAEAVRFGEEVMRTGLWENFPIAGVPLGDVKHLGRRLLEYGRDGK